MRMLVAGIVVVGVSAGLMSGPVEAEQPRHDKKLEKAVIEQVQRKMGDVVLRDSFAMNEDAEFVTIEDVDASADGPTHYSPPSPDPTGKGAKGAPSKPLVYVDPLAIDTTVTTSNDLKGKEKRTNRIRLLWERFDVNGDPVR